MFKTKMLKKNYEFRKVLSKGKHYSGKYIEIVILKNNKKNTCLGIAISTKIGKAVVRNHIKRLIREVYKITENKIIDGYSIVFLWKKSVTTEKATFNNIKSDVDMLFDKANIIEYEKNID